MPRPDLSTPVVCALTWLVVGAGFGAASGLGQQSVAAGLITGVVLGTVGAVLVGLTLGGVARFEPVTAARLRAVLPWAVLLVTLAGAPVMGVLVWVALRT